MARPRQPVTLNQLRTFETVIERQSITRAAEALHITQPAVSLQLKELAQSVGMPIFEMVGRKVMPTEAGRALMATTCRIFDTWSDFESTVAGLQGLKKGRLRLAAVTTAEYFVPSILGPFSARYPGIEVSLAVENRNKVVERLAGNVDDLYIMGMPPDALDLVREPFLANPLVVVAARKHPLSGQSVALGALAGERFLMREAGSGTRMAAERFMREHGLAIDVAMELGSNEAIKRAVAAGLGIAVLSAHAIGPQPERDGISVLAVRGFPIKRSWYLVHQRAKTLSTVGRAFLDYARTLEDAGRGIAQAVARWESASGAAPAREGGKRRSRRGP